MGPQRGLGTHLRPVYMCLPSIVVVNGRENTESRLNTVYIVTVEY